MRLNVRHHHCGQFRCWSHVPHAMPNGGWAFYEFRWEPRAAASKSLTSKGSESSSSVHLTVDEAKQLVADLQSAIRMHKPRTCPTCKGTGRTAARQGEHE